MATDERRTFSNMVIVLLEQALAREHEPVTKEVTVGGIGTMQMTTSLRAERDDHFKPDPKR